MTFCSKSSGIIRQHLLWSLQQNVKRLEVDYLQQRAACGSRAQLLAILERAPDVEPDPEDRLP